MAVVELAGDHRRRKGKGGTRKLRRDGFIPAVLYGGEETPSAIKVEYKEFETLVRTPGGVHSVIDFKLPEQANIMALIREVQRDPLTREIIHVDFQRIEEGKPVHVEVPLILVGIPEGVKIGGVLEQVTREIDVKCLPRDIPGRWEVDVSALTIGDSITVGDLDMPNLEVLTDTERTIAVVQQPTVHAEEAAEEAEVEEEGAEEAKEGKTEASAEKGGDED